FLLTTEPFKLDFTNIDEIQGVMAIISIRGFVDLYKSLFKIVFIAAVTFTIIWIYKDDMMMLAFKDVNGSLSFFGKTTIIMGISATIALLFLSVFDYMYHRYDFEKIIRMSKHDIKDEHKNIERDPLIDLKSVV